VFLDSEKEDFMVDEEIAMMINHSGMRREDREKVGMLLGEMYNHFRSSAELSRGLYD